MTYYLLTLIKFVCVGKIVYILEISVRHSSLVSTSRIVLIFVSGYAFLMNFSSIESLPQRDQRWRVHNEEIEEEGVQLDRQQEGLDIEYSMSLQNNVRWQPLLFALMLSLMKIEFIETRLAMGQEKDIFSPVNQLKFEYLKFGQNLPNCLENQTHLYKSRRIFWAISSWSVKSEILI